MQKQPLILTLKLDADSQAFFNTQRSLYFPAERNFLEAHLTLFHQLPDEPSTREFLAKVLMNKFTLRVTGLMNLGAGVAYRVESPDLTQLHTLIGLHFKSVLIPQDRQGFRPHIVVMNKTTPAIAKALIVKLIADFEPFEIHATSLDLWTYLGGPWQHECTFTFIDNLA